jgi:hypothetical protein
MSRAIPIAILTLALGACGVDEAPTHLGDDGGLALLDGQSPFSQPDFASRPAPQQDGTAPPPPKADAAPPPPGADAAPPSPCKGQESFFNGHCYLAIGYKWMDYLAASQICAANQGKVASILSQAENQFVLSLLPPLNQAAWIGLRRKSGTFTWVDGDPVGYVNWAPGEPNNEDGKEECTVMWGPHLSTTAWHGKWNDVPCDAPGRDTVICKRKP